MDDTLRTHIEATFRASNAGRLHFDEVIARHVAYLGRCGESHAEHFPD